MGRSNLRKTDREQPAGERRLRNLGEYLPELRTENDGSSRIAAGQYIRAYGKGFLNNRVGCVGLAPVIVLK